MEREDLKLEENSVEGGVGRRGNSLKEWAVGLVEPEGGRQGGSCRPREDQGSQVTSQRV
jgi:hypothetical protein